MEYLITAVGLLIFNTYDNEQFYLSWDSVQSYKVIEQKPSKCIVVDNLFNSDKSYHKLNDECVKFYPLDISKLDEMEYIFSTYKPDYVFHCASMLIQDSETLPRKSINTNIMGTFNIVDLSNKYGKMDFDIIFRGKDENNLSI